METLVTNRYVGLSLFNFVSQEYIHRVFDIISSRSGRAKYAEMLLGDKRSQFWRLLMHDIGTGVFIEFENEATQNAASLLMSTVL